MEIRTSSFSSCPQHTLSRSKDEENVTAQKNYTSLFPQSEEVLADVGGQGQEEEKTSSLATE